MHPDRRQQVVRVGQQLLLQQRRPAHGLQQLQPRGVVGEDGVLRGRLRRRLLQRGRRRQRVPHVRLHLLLPLQLLLLLGVGELDDERRGAALHRLGLVEALDGAQGRLLAGEGDEGAAPGLARGVPEDGALFYRAVAAEERSHVVLAELLVEHADEEFSFWNGKVVIRNFLEDTLLDKKETETPKSMVNDTLRIYEKMVNK